LDDFGTVYHSLMCWFEWLFTQIDAWLDWVRRGQN